MNFKKYTNIRSMPIGFILFLCVTFFVPELWAQESVTISLVVRTGLESQGLRKVAQAYTEKTGIKIDVLELGRDGYLSAVPTQLVTRSAIFDIAFIPSTMIAELAAAKAVLPLDDLIKVDDPDLIATYGYQGKTYALPTDASTMFMYYRNDLISKPPETWEDAIKLARQFSKATNPKSPTLYGLGFPGMAGEDLPKTFYSILWSYGGFINDGSKIGIGNAQSIEAAGLLRRLINEKVLPKDITSWGFSQTYENLESGRLAMAVPFWNATATLLLASKSSFKDKISWAMIPGTRQADGSILRIPFQHAWTLALSSNSKQPKSAAEFIAYATGTEGGRIYAQAVSGNPARYSLLEDPVLRSTRPEFTLLLQSLKIARAEPATPKYAALHDSMNQALTQILTGTRTPEKAMKEAGKKISRLGLGRH